ncbi:hypothetical protein TKK_0015225 [Trichogramma kaykai]
MKNPSGANELNGHEGEDVESSTLIDDHRKIELVQKNEKSPDDDGELVRTKIYRRRWAILFLFTLFTAGNKAQWVQYTVVLNVVSEFFQVSSLAIKSTTMVYSLAAPFLVYPISYVEHRWGMRSVMILASSVQALGAWIKYFGTRPAGYGWTILGQSLVGFWQMLTLSMPASLAAHWFGPSQINTATAIAFGGLVVGVSTFSLLTPMIVRVNEDQGVVEAQMKSLGLPLAAYCTLVMILILVFFQNEPKLPPSKSRALQLRLKAKRFDFWKSFARLLRNRNYVLLWISHGINGGLIITSHASVNVLVLAHFKNGERDAGRLSLLFSSCGFFLAIIMGKVLDKTKKFKAMMIFLYTGNIFSIIAVGLSFHFEIKWAMYLSFTVMGIFMHSYQTTSFDTCAEITYPEPEIFCVSMLNLMNQVFGVFTITCSDKLIVRYGDAAAYCLFLGLALLGFATTLLTADERRRQNANDRSKP